MIKRPEWLARIRSALKRSRVTLLVGPRQSGKTTLARQIVSPDSPGYFDLEDPRSPARLAEPMTSLEPLRGIIVIDEIQRRPDLFPLLRVLSDRRPLRARFLILGSASPGLLRQSSETLAGRVETLILSGLELREIGVGHLRRQQFIQTSLERDLPQLGISIPSEAMLRFWTMLAHAHGNIWNASDPGRSLGVSQPAVRRYLDLLTGLSMVRQLQPWHANLTKRQVKSPKVYVRDCGVLHALLGLRTDGALLSHPKIGASWEGYIIEEVLKAASPDAVYFWATHQGAELDLLLVKGSKRAGVEIKYQDAPELTRSMRIAMEDLQLNRLTVICPGESEYTLARRVQVIPASKIGSKDHAWFAAR